MEKDQQPPGSKPEAEPLSVVESLEELRSFASECRACQKDLEQHWQFCAHCGVRLATHCPKCKEPLPPTGAQTCAHCGLEIPEIAAGGSGGG